MVLVRPSIAYRDSYLTALREFQTEGRNLWLDYEATASDFASFVQRNLDRSDPTRMPAGDVPASVFWLVEGNEFVGRVTIRHRLNDQLRQYGGHIGFEIRPSHRRRGYGTTALRLALLEAGRWELQRVSVMCDAENIGSRLVIERNDGEFESEAPWEGHVVRRYWIATTKP